MTSEIEWRRGWSPDLKSSSWKPLTIDSQDYLIKVKFADDSYEMLLTNLSEFWYEKLAGNALSKRIKKLNPSIEAPTTKILDQIRQNISSSGKGTSLDIIMQPTNSLVLEITSHLAGMPFCWKFRAEPADKQMLSSHLLLPLMSMVEELSRRQAELVQIIAAKDKEIDDYKSQGSKTSRKHIATVPYDGKAFTNNMVSSPAFESVVKRLGVATFDEDSQDLYRQIMVKNAWLSRSPRKVKPRDSLDDDESLADVPRESHTSWGTNRIPASLGQTKSPTKRKSPDSSPHKSPTASPVKDPELLRRQALEKKLENEESKKQEKAKKKKKLAL